MISIEGLKLLQKVSYLDDTDTSKLFSKNGTMTKDASYWTLELLQHGEISELPEDGQLIVRDPYH